MWSILGISTRGSPDLSGPCGEHWGCWVTSWRGSQGHCCESAAASRWSRMVAEPRWFQWRCRRCWICDPRLRWRLYEIRDISHAFKYGPHGLRFIQFSSVQSFSHVWVSCDPMDCSTPGFPVHHQLPELAHTHVHQVSDAIQPSHPLSSPSPPAFNLSQHQCLFQWVSSSHQVAKVLEFQLQHQSFQWIFRTDFL